MHFVDERRAVCDCCPSHHFSTRCTLIVPTELRTTTYQLFLDTDPAVEQMLLDRIRELSPQRKPEMMAELNTNMRAMALIGLRSRHPSADDAELQRCLADLLLGEKLAEQIFGPLPRVTHLHME